MTASPSSTEPSDDLEPRPGAQVRVELLAGLASVAIALFFLIGSGSGRLDWIFPDTLGYALGAAGVALIVRGILGYGDLVPIVPPILRGAGREAAIFIGISVAYVVLIRPLGFWPVSGLMIFVTSLYLSDNRSRRSLLTSLTVALTVCALGFLLLERVFYVPYPKVRWLPF